MTAFNSALGLAARSVSPTYAQLYSGEWEHPGSALRSRPREVLVVRRENGCSASNISRMRNRRLSAVVECVRGIALTSM